MLGLVRAELPERRDMHEPAEALSGLSTSSDDVLEERCARYIVPAWANAFQAAITRKVNPRYTPVKKAHCADTKSSVTQSMPIRNWEAWKYLSAEAKAGLFLEM